ncbi:hypothetical protein BIU88_09710 [Chlorobaculum limnaeum]|uniref:Uncharacterized protein n=2 Tax=Chlorobaculum limnaeum TaxID=274537 RepID=A0A1D8D1V0_CHLLM|nr:hypothetical protein BIU88_09710 [Chlorobaculum limnaeum]
MSSVIFTLMFLYLYFSMSESALIYFMASQQVVVGFILVYATADNNYVDVLKENVSNIEDDSSGENNDVENNGGGG